VRLTAQIAVFPAATVVAVPLFPSLELGAGPGYLAAGVVIKRWGHGRFTAAALLAPSKPVPSRPAVELGDH
jgi:Kef-type K+ transport system membrane component KefB